MCDPGNYDNAMTQRKLLLSIGLPVGVAIGVALWSQARVAASDPSLSEDRRAFLACPVVMPTPCGLVTIPALDQTTEPRFTVEQALLAKGQNPDQLEFGNPDHSMANGNHAVRFWWSAVAAPVDSVPGKTVHLRLDLTKGRAGWTVSDVSLLGILGRKITTAPTEGTP
jgi:hypothetical protein